MRKILLSLVLLATSALAADPALTPFQPSGAFNSGLLVSSYRVAVSNSSTAFTASSGTSNPQWTFCNEGSVTAWLSAGPSASLAMTIPSAGTGTIGAAGNARPIFGGNCVVWTFLDGWYFRLQTESSTTTVDVEPGLGN